MAEPVDPLERLPHRPPFRFLSRVLEREPGVSGVGVWSVSGAEAFFTGHFPDEPIVPGVLIAEALAQLAGVVAFVGASKAPGPRAAHLAQVNVRFFAPVAPPADILLHARVARAIGGLRLMEVRAECRGEVAASGQVTLAAAGGPGEGRA